MIPPMYFSPVAGSVPFDNTSNGFAANNVQAALEELKITYAEATATANATTTSSTDALLTGMTVTPSADTYLVMFSTSITSDVAGAAISASLYVGGVQRADTLRKIIPADGGALSTGSARGVMQLQAIVAVNGLQALEIRWSTSSGTATCGPRTLSVVRFPP